jgi:hypothetical protein
MEDLQRLSFSEEQSKFVGIYIFFFHKNKIKLNKYKKKIAIKWKENYLGLSRMVVQSTIGNTLYNYIIILLIIK